MSFKTPASVNLLSLLGSQFILLWPEEHHLQVDPEPCFSQPLRSRVSGTELSMGATCGLRLTASASSGTSQTFSSLQAPSHPPDTQQTLKQAMRHLPSSQPLLVLRGIPALKMEKLRTYTVETKNMEWHELNQCSCSLQDSQGHSGPVISYDGPRLWEGDILHSPMAMTENSTPGTF